MSFNFDEVLPLRGAHTSKYDAIERVFGSNDPDIIPMWVADMDFRTAPPILDALRDEVERGYLGYFTDNSAANAAVVHWMADRQRWSIEPDAIRYTHGVVGGIGVAVAGCSRPGDGVIVFSPVYHAFYRQIRAMKREVIESPLKIENGRFEMDLGALAASLTGREKILILCSPHNPGGRVWSADELQAVADFCAEHDLILISDEIHGDLTYPGTVFTPTLTVAPEHASRTIVLTAATKPFNIAGVETGMMIIPDAAMRRKLDPVIDDREASPNRFAMAAYVAAYSEGAPWLDAARAYIAKNFHILHDRLNAMPGVGVMNMPATYLAWVDFGGLGLDDAELLKRFVTKAKVVANPGPQFGTGGSGHMRLNVALPRATLITALDRIEAAFADAG